MFNTLDADGGGSLSRQELVMALFKLNVDLQPSEMTALMEFLDEDGSGATLRRVVFCQLP